MGSTWSWISHIASHNGYATAKSCPIPWPGLRRRPLAAAQRHGLIYPPAYSTVRPTRKKMTTSCPSPSARRQELQRQGAPTPKSPGTAAALTARERSRCTSGPSPRCRGLTPPASGTLWGPGFLSGLAWGLDHWRSAADRLCGRAPTCWRPAGTQEYDTTREDILGRLRRTYGDEAAAEIEPHPRPRPLTQVCRREPSPSPWQLSVAQAEPREDLVGVANDLAPGTLLRAYRNGLFPMGLGHHGVRTPSGWWVA